ncbi:mRNA turnover 4 [Xylographa pallens]|nr:mRNA turnover 4 [Xylographa pallens]
MPRSKRAKVVHLSKVTKKGKALTLKTYAAIQASVAQHPYLYVFAVDNMRNTYLKDVRAQLADSRYVQRPPKKHPRKPLSPVSRRMERQERKRLANHHPPARRLFFGKTKVMAAALGRSAADEPAPHTALLTPHLSGTIGLLFSPRPPAEIQAYFAGFHPLDYARAGTTATRTFVLPAGVLYSRGGEIAVEEDMPLAHSVEPSLRKWGVPTRLVKGRVELEGEYVVCREGEVLGSGQATLLKMFGVATAEFGVELKAYWVKETAEVVVLAEGEAGGGAEGAEDGEDELVDDDEMME